MPHRIRQDVLGRHRHESKAHDRGEERRIVEVIDVGLPAGDDRNKDSYGHCRRKARQGHESS